MANLILKKCAYLFHESSNNFFYGTRADYKVSEAVNAYLFSFYEDDEKRAELIPADVSENGAIYITIPGGHQVRVNDAMINYIDIPGHVSGRLKPINNMHDIYWNNDELVKRFRNNDVSCNWLISRKYKTLQFDNYTGADNLDYFRIHFNNNYINFCITKDGEILRHSCGRYESISRQKLCKYIGVKSDTARREIYLILDAIINA